MYRRDYDVDILVRGWRHLELTAHLLQSIRDNTPVVKYHVTYVDNGSEHRGDLRDLQEEFPDMTVVCLPFNHGSVRAINVGLSLALLSDAPYILLLDNDTTIPGGDNTWLERFIAYFDDPRVGAVGACSSYVSGHQQAESIPPRFHGDAATELPVLVSFALLLRKTAVEQVEYFDELYEPGNYEDMDYSLQLREAGWKCVIADSVYIQHVGSQTFGSMGFQGLLDANRHKFIEKWGSQRLESLGVRV
jgi:O-antigen biosynthesis protein